MATTGRLTGYGNPTLSGKVGGSLPTLRVFHIPGCNRTITLRDGAIGFLLIHFALWWHEVIHRLDVGTWDEWGWADRPVRGQVSIISEHTGGCAEDLDATLHPRGVPLWRTFTPIQIARITVRLAFYRTRTGRKVLGWGGLFRRTVDGMHIEKAQGAALTDCEQVARRLTTSPRGRRILDANPGLLEVINS